MADTQVHEIVIHASPDNVWDALTNGDVTKRYFFGETIVSDWKPGSSWHSVGPSGSQDVDGMVIEAMAPRRLVVTWHVAYDPALADEQSRVTYEIDPRGPVCMLTVRHDLAHAPKTAKHVAQGWTIVLSGLKTLLETGRSMPMPEM